MTGQMGDVTIKLPACPNCGSFREQVATFGDVEGSSVLDGCIAMSEADPLKGGEFTTRSWHADRCGMCGHQWNYRESDGVRLFLDPRKPTFFERIKVFLS